MFATRRKDRIYKAYSKKVPNKDGVMVSRTFTVEFLGYYSEITRQDPLGYEKLKAKIKAESDAATLVKKEEQAKKLLEKVNGGDNSAKPFKGHPTLNYSNYVLKPLWEALGLDRVLDYHWQATQAEFDAPKLLWQSVVNRVVSPCSHLCHFEERLNWLGAPLCDAEIWDLYRMLDFAYGQKDRILKAVNRKVTAMGLRDLSVVFYDVTNCWYETAYTDEQKLEMRISAKLATLGPNATEEEKEKAVEKVIRKTTSTLRMRGPSKECRRDPIVSIALVVDRNGIPIDFHLYRGNSSEKTTMEDSIAALESKYHIKNTIVTADGGLNTRKNILRLSERKHGFLIARSMAKMKKSLLDKALKPEGWISSGDLRLKEIPMEETIQDGDKATTVKYRLVVGWSAKREREDLLRIESHKKAALAAIADKKNMKGASYGWKKYVVSADSIADSLNDKRIEKDLKIAGYFAYEFKDGREYDKEWSENPTDMVGAMEVMRQYHCLSKIEECFRIMKTNFDLRPLFVYTDVHATAQVLICVLALILIRILSKKLETAGHPMTIDEIIFALANAQVAALIDGDSPVTYAPLRLEKVRLKLGKDKNKTPKFEPYGDTNLSRIMETVGLKPLPKFCGKNELARCLATRFDEDKDAVGHLLPQVIREMDAMR